MDPENRIELHGKTFKKAIPYSQIKAAISQIASRLNSDYRGKETPLIIGVLNGCFMFLSELMQELDFQCELTFVSVSSYRGMSTSGVVEEKRMLDREITGRHVILVEDIIDTGTSIDYLVTSLGQQHPASMATVTLLYKPNVYQKSHAIDYYGLEVGDQFIVGFGLDYDQLGRNLKDIYELDES